jgi:aminoglycoside 3-N-acetyltransferase I
MLLKPANPKIKRLTGKDLRLFKELLKLFEDMFKMKNAPTVKESYLHELLENPTFLAYAIILNNELIGGLTAYELPKYYSEESEVFIYDLAIKAEYQRKGLGKMLISSLKEQYSNAGIREIFVAANIEDKHALKFYHSTGGKVEKVVHFNYKLNS